MKFDYQKTLEKRKNIFIVAIVVAFLVVLCNIFRVPKQYVYFLSGFFIIICPFVFYAIERNNPLYLFYTISKSYKDRRLFNKSEQEFTSLVLQRTNNKIIRSIFSLSNQNISVLNSKFWEFDISEIEAYLKIKSIRELKIGGHIAVPVQGSVILNKAKSVHEYLEG